MSGGGGGLFTLSQGVCLFVTAETYFGTGRTQIETLAGQGDFDFFYEFDDNDTISMTLLFLCFRFHR